MRRTSHPYKTPLASLKRRRTMPSLGNNYCYTQDMGIVGELRVDIENEEAITNWLTQKSSIDILVVLWVLLYTR